MHAARKPHPIVPRLRLTINVQRPACIWGQAVCPSNPFDRDPESLGGFLTVEARAVTVQAQKLEIPGQATDHFSRYLHGDPTHSLASIP